MSASGSVARLSVASGVPLLAVCPSRGLWRRDSGGYFDCGGVSQCGDGGLDDSGCGEGGGLYKRAFGAEEIYRNTYPDGRIVAELAVGEARFRVADEAPEVGNLSPEALGGTSVRLNLLVADPDGVAAVAIANGAIEVAPVADQSYGLRQGRLADPFGHHWLIGRPVAGAAGDWARTAAR
jgi:PhnB protein